MEAMEDAEELPQAAETEPEKPAEPTEPAEPAEPEVETVLGLRVRRVTQVEWLELAARTLEQYRADLEILTARTKDGTVEASRLCWAKNRWSNELDAVNPTTGKLVTPKSRKSVEADEARVQFRLK